MPTIKLTKGLEATVDRADNKILKTRKWCASRGVNGGYYASAFIDGKLIGMHRFLMNPPSDMEVDHINGNTLDNRRKNLRVVTHQQNIAGKSKHPGSLFKGVYLDKRRGKWVAQLKHNYKHVFLGYHQTPSDAARAYDEGAKVHFGIYAKTNFKRRQSCLSITTSQV